MLRSVASSALRTQRLMLRRPVASGAMCSLRHSSSIVPILGIEGLAESESKSALVTQQATPDEMFEWCTGSVGLREEVAAERGNLDSSSNLLRRNHLNLHRLRA